MRYRVISYLCSDTRADESKMSVSFQVRKNTTPFPRGKNQIVMVLFLIWLLRWANLFMCRLPPSLQTFQPTLFGAHTVGTGAWLAVALPWGLCLKLRVDNASLSCPTRTTPSGHTPFLVPSASGLPGQRSMFLTVTGTNKHLEMCSLRWVGSWDHSDPLGASRFQDARWLWVVHRRSDPPEPLEMQYLEQISVRDGFRSLSITGSGEV